MSLGCIMCPVTLILPWTTSDSSGRSVLIPTLPLWKIESSNRKNENQKFPKIFPKKKLTWVCPFCQHNSTSLSNWPGFEALTMIFWLAWLITGKLPFVVCACSPTTSCSATSCWEFFNTNIFNYRPGSISVRGWACPFSSCCWRWSRWSVTAPPSLWSLANWPVRPWTKQKKLKKNLY